MLNGNNIFLKLCEMVDTDSENAAYMHFCNLAAAVISEKLKPGADVNDVRVLSAAAMFAYSRYMMALGTAESEHGSVRMGDITVSSNGKNTAEAANAMLEAALSDASPLFADTSFAFEVI